MCQAAHGDPHVEVAWAVEGLQLIAPNVPYVRGRFDPTPDGLRQVHEAWQENAARSPDGFAVGFLRFNLVSQGNPDFKAYAELSLTDGSLYLTTTT